LDLLETFRASAIETPQAWSMTYRHVIG
jgi:hypothetical protein